MVGRELDLTGLCGRSRAALGAYVGGLGPVLGPPEVVLGRSWGLCWRSWAGPGASGGGLGPESGPGSSGKAIW